MRTPFLAAMLLALTTFAFGAPKLELGLWRAWLDCPGGEMPFTLEIVAPATDEKPAGLTAFLINGSERLEIPVVKWESDELVLSLDYYDAHLRAKVSEDGKRLDGEFTKRRTAAVAKMPFHAELATQALRFRHYDDPKLNAAADLPARWSVRFAGDADAAVGQFDLWFVHDIDVKTNREIAKPSPVDGTFLTTTGDYRFLGGDWNGNTLRLSVFDGAHAFLITATLQPDGSLKGDFWSGNWHHDTWTAVRDDNASLPDAFSFASAVPGANVNALSFPDLKGRTRSLAEPALGGLGESGAPAAEARILYVFGSWCPNCKDAAALLNELQAKHADDGLRVIGLAFEATGDAARDAKQTALYAERSGITFPVLLAGKADKKETAAVLAPIITGFKAYPTAIFVDRAGRVRAVYSGFSGPATGDEHTKLRAQWSKIVEQLLRE